MTFPTCLAMTDAELQANDPKGTVLRMGCGFSVPDAALSHVPETLPEKAWMILDDCIPPNGSDPDQICSTLQTILKTLNPAGFLLDFQRKEVPEEDHLVQMILETVPCPVLVSEAYAKGKTCPVFLSSPPLHKTLRDYLAPWAGREIWLEVAPETQELFLTESGCRITRLPEGDWDLPLESDSLHCHYTVKTGKDWAKFVLSRTFEDLHHLAEEAESLGVKGTVGLYQIFERVAEPEPEESCEISCD